MAAKRTLRAVTPSEAAASSAPSSKSVAQAAKSSQPRELLVAMRDRIASAVTREDCQPRDLASLTKRLQDIVRDIATLDALAQEQGKASKSDGSSSNAYDASVI